MEFSIKSGSPAKAKTGCVVVGVFEGRKLTPAAAELDKASGGFLTEILKRGDHDGHKGSTLLLQAVRKVSAERVLLVGLGKSSEFAAGPYRAAVTAAVKVLKATGTVEASLYLTDLPVKGKDLAWKAEQAALAAAETVYRFDRTKTKHSRKTHLKKIVLHAEGVADVEAATKAIARASAIAAGVSMARDLGNLPANLCTPSILANEAEAMAKAHGLRCQVLGEKEIAKLGMGCFLAVAQGSREPPRFIILEHDGGKKGEAPVVLVGKGVTFDTGGISLKPSAEMDEMKFDMCGAASVIGAMKAVALMKLPVNVVALVPATENMPGGKAVKPGDVVTTMSGQTVEILNTDAEGRLILCDALTYAERYKPAAVIDVATLTGAMVISLGHIATGLFANDDDLARELVAAGDAAWDRAWHLPLWEEYQDALKSHFADIPNIGPRAGGAITAACFLSRFTKAYKWAHLDIAGTAWKSGAEKGATGRPVAQLAHFLARRAA